MNPAIRLKARFIGDFVGYMVRYVSKLIAVEQVKSSWSWLYGEEENISERGRSLKALLSSGSRETKHRDDIKKTQNGLLSSAPVQLY